MTHKCHWNGCTREVPPQKWGCKRHWFMLPIRFRAKIIGYYRPGQEIEKNPSRDYIDAVLEAQNWIKYLYNDEKIMVDEAAVEIQKLNVRLTFAQSYKADAERLDWLENNALVNSQYENITIEFEFKDCSVNSIREAIDQAKKEAKP